MIDKGHKVDPLKHQYGNYIVFNSHDVGFEKESEIWKLVQDDIDNVFDGVAKPKIRKWKSEKWMVEFDDEDPECGKGVIYLDHDTCGGQPVTLFLWKSIVPKRAQGGQQ